MVYTKGNAVIAGVRAQEHPDPFDDVAYLTLDVANVQEKPAAFLAQLLVPSLIFLLMGSKRVSYAFRGCSSKCLSGCDCFKYFC